METESISEVLYFGTRRPFSTTKDFEEGVQTLDTAITDMSACSVNYWLSKFVQEVSNSSGERYPIPICGPKRHLSEVNGSAALNPLSLCIF